MKEIIVDTNIVFSSLIRSRRIQRIMTELYRKGYTIHTARELIEELKKHKEKILQYTSLPVRLLETIIEELFPKILTLHHTDTIPYQIREKAKELVRDMDPDDWPFVALAMYLEVPLWTGDKGIIELSVRTRFRHFVAVDTEGVEMLLEGKSLGEVEERMREKYG